jgi:peptidoglycan biosynthesis protein MviN/MurJ (putative lipid II flippase)
MNTWLSRANRRLTLTSAAALLVGTALLGQVLGFMRVQVINGNFNRPGHITTDAYFAAFKIPDLFFYTIAAGALGVAFMPFLADRLEKGDRKTVWALTSSLLNLLGIAMFFVGVILLVFTVPLIHVVIGHNLSPDQMHDAVTIMRIVAFNPLLFTISGVLTSLQQTFGRFFFYALAPLLYNGCIIASVYIFRNNLGIVGLGIGALAGAILQLAFVLIGLAGMRFRYIPRIHWSSPDFKRILRNLPPRSIDQNRPDLFRKDFLMVMRAMIWIILPVAVVGFFTRAYLARLIYKNIAPEIALIFGFLVGAIIFRTLYSIISRYFYAQKDTRTPLFVSIFTIGLNIVLAFTLAKPQAYGVAGLAIAQSVVATVEVFILLIIMLWRDHKLFSSDFWTGIVRIFSVTGFTILTTYIMVTLIPLERTDRGFTTLSIKLLAIVIPSFAVHIGISSLFAIEEVQPVIRKVKQVALKPVRIQ